MPIQVGTEEPVNTTDNGSQTAPQVAALATGGWVVTWASFGQDGSGYGIYQQRYNSAGLKIGEETLVNSGSGNQKGDQIEPSIAALATGGWVVTWTSYQGVGGDPDIYQRFFPGTGSAGSPTLVVGDDNDTQYRSDVAGLSDGSWVVTWTDYENNIDPDIYQAHFGGGSSGDPQLVSVDKVGGLSENAIQDFARVTGLENGGWVVTWSSDQDGDRDIYQRRYDGSPSTPESHVNAAINLDQFDPKTAALADGGWVTVWTSGSDVLWRKYASTGATSGADVSLAPTVAGTVLQGNQTAYGVTGLPDGGFVITWTSDGGDGGDKFGKGVFQQRYASTGEKIGEAFLVNTYTTGNQSDADIAALPNGSWVVTWTSDGQKGPGKGLDVYHRLYSTALTISGTSVAELAAPGTVVGVLPESDILGTLTYTLFNNAAGRFTLTGNTLRVANGGALNYEAAAAHLITVIATDVAGLSSVQTFSIKVTNVNEAPTGPALTGTSVKELSPNGTVVGLLSATELDAGDTITYKLTGGDTGRFEIVGNQLRVKKGILLDYEQAKSHTVAVTATDAGGLSTTQDFAIKVANVSTEKTAGTSGIDVVVGGGGKDTLGGGGGNDRLTGGGSTDTLRGGSGNDRLDGGLGRDTLYGNSGKDAFLFTTKPGGSNVDTLRDFQPVDDVIRLENAIFKGIGSGSLKNPKVMLADAFQLGPVAQDAEDRILYDQATGSVFYDPDGIGAAAAIRFAVVATKRALTHHDFYVI